MLKSGKNEISLKIPHDYKDMMLDNGKYCVQKLKTFFEEDCRQLAEAFDNRNGNTWYMDQIAIALK